MRGDEQDSATAARHAGSATEASARRAAGRRRARPSLVLWRARHLVVAVCLGAAAVVALALLRPAPAQGREVLVAAHEIRAGAVVSAGDLTARTLPETALPEGSLPTRADLVGARAAVSLPRGTVLTASMTSAGVARGLSRGDRIVQVPVEIGASLAEPGAKVDIVSSDDGAAVVCEGARVVERHAQGGGNQWTSGSKVTLVTLAVPSPAASLVIGAAADGALGLVLSP